MLPAGKCPDAIHPLLQIGIAGERDGQLVTIEHISAQRDIGDRQPLADDEGIVGQMPVDDLDGGDGAGPQEFRYRSLARLGEVDEEAQGRETRRELVIVCSAR